MTILITGASSGIGEKTARLFAQKGYRVIGIGRDELKLKKLQQDLGQSHIFLVLDITSDDTQKTLTQFLKQNEIKIDVLINNAGINHIGLLGEIDLKKADEVFKVNVLGALAITQACLPFLIPEKSQIIQISSLAAMVGIPNRSVYSASKKALEILTEAWRMELKEKKIQLKVLRLAGVDTNFHFRTQTDGYAEKSKISVKSPEEIAEYIYKILKSRRKIFAPGFTNKIYQATAKLCPPLFRFGVYLRFLKEKKLNEKVGK